MMTIAPQTSIPRGKPSRTLTDTQKISIEKKAVASLWTPEETAQYLGVTVGTLQVWRTTKRYPLPYLKIGRKAMYDPAAVIGFAESRTVR